ncbi:hypothetical protein JZ751_012606 [Albula glossodonta]|uniref:ZP domain-containing protein n=1 Tax=Albula glossodonta TaxID=121402 RepID=A0A8T2NVG8_9TELE|nr:hypothetical protein JZ751_012606 [Albula glossodonta]
MDSKLTSSRSKFLSREQDGKLQFQLDAFRFAQESRSSIYITCHLRATAAASASEGKACSFSIAANGWTSASGDDQACSCCDTGCSMRKGRSLAAETAVHEADMVLGPLIVQRVVPDDDMVHEFQSNRLTAEDHRAAGVSPVAVVMAGMVAAVGLVCVVVLGAVLIRTRHKP